MSKAGEVLGRFSAVTLPRDIPAIPPDVRAALPAIRAAMDGITEVFLRQQDEALPGLRDRVLAGEDEELKAFFSFFKGPWDPLSNHASVLDDVADRRPGCAFYPPDAETEALQAHIDGLRSDERAAFSDHYSVIRREGDRLLAAPYHEYYRDLLRPISDRLLEAAGMVKHEGLASYLEVRAHSLLDATYREADSAWVRLKETPLELVLGPYEVYADGVLGLKATYEAMLLVPDTGRAARLQQIEDELDALAAVFPVPDGAKPALGGVAPIVVAHEVYATGDAAAGIMASAFNLPNDPWVRGNVGWKQVMIYNVMQAKFERCGLPIAEHIVEGGSRARFDPYFTFVLLHEVSHGLGPAYRADGSSVAKVMGSHYTPIEECKADTGSVFLLQKLGGRHGIPAFDDEALLDSYLPGLFRSMRFGLHEAHGAANIIQFNWFSRHGVIEQTASGRFTTHPARFSEATAELLDTLTHLQAAGTPDEVSAFLAEHAHAGDDIVGAIESLEHIPIDVRVTFPEV